jgi:hypothetical protein
LGSRLVLPSGDEADTRIRTLKRLRVAALSDNVEQANV